MSVTDLRFAFSTEQDANHSSSPLRGSFLPLHLPRETTLLWFRISRSALDPIANRFVLTPSYLVVFSAPLGEICCSALLFLARAVPARRDGVRQRFLVFASASDGIYPPLAGTLD